MRASPSSLVPSSTQAYWVETPGRGAIRQEALSLPVPEGHSLIETWVTGISPGTERLVGLGHVPPECRGTMECPSMGGSFELPAKYGYCLVGRAVNGPYANRRVFTMHPHQDYAIVPEDRLLPLPEDLPPLRATLIPNMETALNAIWDSEYQPPAPVAIVGGGIVGLLIAFLLKTAWDSHPLIIEIDKQRRQLIEELGWGLTTLGPQDSPREAFSLCFHSSGQGSGLQTALDSVGFEGRVIEVSWLGHRPVSLHLGGSFHFQRKQILSSQVSTIAKPKRGHLTHRQRLEQVLVYLQNPRLDALISQVIRFDNLPLFMQQLYHKNPDGFSFAVIYRPFERYFHKT
ncbi:putative dehydrogenase [Nitrosococcus halophilus Nc 4]|uniref:Dehydrogenase n=1 Tax=Nitrosococcus halophilus (strain Nc4) TaxID=472759 RepID=D5C4H3_NITHN|nr:zinc-binding alcohol dehydrogenase [Nitrosococcus halophilus]ADE15157.1 putative dehydrogenase [Nitrosococcus halophilus Nc 4]